MNRTEWAEFSHSIRADARAFHEKHGGYECFTREFEANGRLHDVTRYRDYSGQHTVITTARIPDQTDSQLAAKYLADAATDRRHAHSWAHNRMNRKASARAMIRATRLLREDPSWRERARAAARNQMAG